MLQWQPAHAHADSIDHPPYSTIKAALSEVSANPGPAIAGAAPIAPKWASTLLCQKNLGPLGFETAATQAAPAMPSLYIVWFRLAALKPSPVALPLALPAGTGLAFQFIHIKRKSFFSFPL